MSHRKERFSSTLKHCLAEVLMMDMNDPHLRGVSIVDVVPADDLKSARVYFAPGSPMEALNRARGFIKRSLAGRMYLKYVPELYFVSGSELGTGSPGESGE